MERAEFDPRYPAEYQPGGDSLPRASNRPPEAPRSEASEAVPEPADVVVGRDAEPIDPDREYLPNAGREAAAPRPWTARTWVLGLGAGMVTTLLGVLCLLPKEASKADPGGGTYVLMALTFPLTDKVAALGPFIIIAGLAMLLAMFLGGAPRHPQASLRLRVAAALVAVAALVAAAFSLFAVSLHPEFLLFMFAPQEGATYAYPWIQLTYLATVPLALFGLCAGAAVAIVRPNGGGTNSLSAARAGATGVVLLLGSAVTFYAPQIFTQSMGPSTFTHGDASIQLTPWPVTLVQVGPYLLFVALASLLLAVYLRLTAAPVETVPEPAADLDNMG